jgi:hypothetical protein
VTVGRFGAVHRESGNDFVVIPTVIVAGFLLAILSLHLVALQVTAIVGNIRVGGDTLGFARVTQALVATIVLFGATYYYLQLFTDGKAFEGMHAIGFENKSYRLSTVDKILLVPAGESVLDCFYFSTITIATVGYGDIRPISWQAKVATMVEVVAGFLLIVVSIASTVGNTRNQGDREI